MRVQTLIPMCLACALVACGKKSDESAEASSSEVAVSVVSGALNNTNGSAVGWNDAPRRVRPLFERALDELAPIRTAWAATWTCTGGTLMPTFAGPGSYAFTPVSCSVQWGNGKMASSTWSGAFTLDYGASCDALHPWIEHQGAGCALTRTTTASGNARTITGPEGNSYIIVHNTDGAGTGWDTSVTPAPTNSGVTITCDPGGCEAQKTLVIAGSHLTGTLAPSGGAVHTWWDHTVSTGADGIVVTGTGSSRVANGTVIVQHNLLKYTATTTFDHVGYGGEACCFPTAGSVSTTFQSGANQGKTETLTFSAVCGESVLTRADGTTVPLVLQHCI